MRSIIPKSELPYQHTDVQGHGTVSEKHRLEGGLKRAGIVSSPDLYWGSGTETRAGSVLIPPENPEFSEMHYKFARNRIRDY